MNSEMQITKTTFETIQHKFPQLNMNLQQHSPTEISLDIPQQDNLKFEINLNLQNEDELHLYVGNFWYQWHPCTNTDRLKQFTDAVIGILLGKYRIHEHYYGKRLFKAELQMPWHADWRTIAVYRTFRIPFPFKKTYRFIQNI